MVFIVSSMLSGACATPEFLIDFYRTKGINASKILFVPSTVDPSRFLHKRDKPFPFLYIGYFGGLTFIRDNVDILVKAFTKINNNHSEIRLVLGGFCSKEEKEQLMHLIAKLNITHKVILLEYLKREEIINYISNSHILVMVRANNFETKASFPSKLTEFLATSNPVITVNVGEISDYLSDSKNAFLVDAGDIEGLAEKLNFVLDNHQFAREVALKGKVLTNTIFNYNYQAKRMIDFIYSMK